MLGVSSRKVVKNQTQDVEIEMSQAVAQVRIVVGVRLSSQTAQRGQDVERHIAHQRGVHTYAPL